MRSIPEKTFEHWVSLYIAARFPLDDQWWPSDGEDIALGLASVLFPRSGSPPAKLIMLELKVPEWDVDMGRHVLKVDRYQLDAYLQRRLPVFYVLPDPGWYGPLAVDSASALSAPATAAGLWRQRSGRSWFGNWTWVISAEDLDAHVTANVATATVYSLSPHSPHYRPGARATAKHPRDVQGAMRWRDFWTSVTKCGPLGSTRWRWTPERGWRDLNREEYALDLLDSLIVEGETSTAVVWLGEDSLLLQSSEQPTIP